MRRCPAHRRVTSPPIRAARARTVLSTKSPYRWYIPTERSREAVPTMFSTVLLFPEDTLNGSAGNKYDSSSRENVHGRRAPVIFDTVICSSKPPAEH